MALFDKTSTRDQLRLNGFSVTPDGHIDCHAAGAINPHTIDQFHRRLRFEQEHCAVIKIDGPRELVEKLIEAADSPRALVGRSKSGAALLFRHEKGQGIDPNKRNVFEFEAAKITFASEGQTVDVGAWDFGKRSPLNTSRDSLPILTADLIEIVVKAAKQSCAPAIDAEQVAREARHKQRDADYAAGKLRILSDEEIAAERDAEIVRRHEGKDYSESDANSNEGHGIVVLARQRHAARLAAKKQVEEDAALVAQWEGREVDEILRGGWQDQQIKAARARHAARQQRQSEPT